MFQFPPEIEMKETKEIEMIRPLINVCRIIFLEIKFFSSCRTYANQSLPLPALQPLESCFFTVFKSCFKLGAPVPSLPRTGQKERKGKGKT